MNLGSSSFDRRLIPLAAGRASHHAFPSDFILATPGDRAGRMSLLGDCHMIWRALRLLMCV